MQRKTWDIFCRIVDNFGDIGVCWRLARQLSNEHDLQIRLFVDDLQVASKIIPIININKSFQLIDNIEIINFNVDAKPAEVVIETFACGLPKNYQNQMTESTIWVNLEYLSAENWVADFHAKSSPQANGLTRHFYFPGFTAATGGLLREANVAAELQSSINPRPLAGEGARQRGRGAAYVGLHAAPLSNLSPAYGREAFVGDSLKISLFCYPNAPINHLCAALEANQNKAVVYVPATSILPKIAQFFGKDSVEIGETLSRGNLTVNILPFLSQPEYDQLLRDCDINFVRGEDSWVRAIWAGKPFIWQPYEQSENLHLTKLKAFVDLHFFGYEQKMMLWKAYEYWLSGHGDEDALLNCINGHQNLQSIYAQSRAQLMQQSDLCTRLLAFCQALHSD